MRKDGRRVGRRVGHKGGGKGAQVDEREDKGGVRKEGVRNGRRERVRGECGFSSLMKQKKRREKLRCLLLLRKKKNVSYLFMM